VEFVEDEVAMDRFFSEFFSFANNNNMDIPTCFIQIIILFH
jgi:hypothetical protein